MGVIINCKRLFWQIRPTYVGYCPVEIVSLLFWMNKAIERVDRFGYCTYGMMRVYQHPPPLYTLIGES